MSDDLKLTGMADIETLLRQLSPSNFIKVIVKASVKVGEQFKDRLVKPPGPSHSPVKWASRKQRVWYILMRQAKGYPLKYARTSDPMSQKLDQSWVVKETRDGAIVGNPATYAPYVVSEEKQSAQHAATGWKTEAMAVREVEESGIIGQYIAAELASFFRSIGGS